MVKIYYKNLKHEKNKFISKTNGKKTIIIKIMKNNIFLQFDVKCKTNIKVIKTNNNNSKYTNITEDTTISCYMNSYDIIELNYVNDKNDFVIIENMFEKIVDNFEKINIKKIFVITLEKDIERQNKIIKNFKEYRITDYEFIDAINGEDCKEEYKLIKKNGSNIKSIGHYGCLKSHIKALELAKQRNYENIVILEDDIFIDDRFYNIKNLLIPNKNIIYFGGITHTRKLFFDDIGIAQNAMGCYGYYVDKKYYDKIIEIYNLQTDCIDTMLIEKLQNIEDIYILDDYVKTLIETTNTSDKKPLFYENYKKTFENYIIEENKIEYVDYSKINNKFVVKNYMYITDIKYNENDKSKPWLFKNDIVQIDEDINEFIDSKKEILFYNLYSLKQYENYFSNDNFKLINSPPIVKIEPNKIVDKIIIGYVDDEFDMSSINYLLNIKNYKNYSIEYIEIKNNYECVTKLKNLHGIIFLQNYDILYSCFDILDNIKIMCLNKGYLKTINDEKYYKYYLDYYDIKKLIEYYENFLDIILEMFN